MAQNVSIAITPQEAAIVQSILQARIPTRPVWAFGSRTNGRARRRSDLDLAVGGSTPLTLQECALLADDFDESDLAFKVDVVDLNAITPEFKQRIERDFLTIFQGSAQSVEEAIA